MNCLMKSLYVLMFLLIATACKEDKQTMLKGEAKLYTDNSVFPVVEDQLKIFQNTYTQAAIELVATEENQLINKLIQDSVNLLVLPRLLTDKEEKIFRDKKIKPRITRFGIDAVVFITNKQNQDSVVNLTMVANDLKQIKQLDKSLVFDNPNSSVTNTLLKHFGMEITPETKLFSKGNAQELIKYVSSNQDCIGVLSLNWITQYPLELENFIQNIKVLGVQIDDNQVVFPTQNKIATKAYPLTRELFFLNYQGTSGLGMGFASFLTSDIGQKIMLTSGLAPMEVNPMKITVMK
ncbi:MAG: substrate-binding domain-containing protein [Bacteroidota bacterium]|nr:substrate-binding domain-containing protein [Bacteroidota bacterium]